MTDANQVRINELARELEVKAKAIIDLLPGYGVTEKKTHSSSIPADVAEKVRKKILGAAEEEAQAEAAAKAEKEAKEAAAKAARLRPAAPVAPPQASVAPAAVKPSAPASPAAPAAKPSAPAAPTATAPAAPKALTPTPAPAVLPPAEKPAAPAAAAPKPIPIRPAPAGAPATPAGARPSAPARPATPSGTQPSGNRPAAAAPGAVPGRPGGVARPGAPARPLPTGNRGPMPSGPTGNRGPLPDTGRESRPSGPRPGQPMRPQQPGQGRPFTPRSGAPGGPGGPQPRPFEQRRGPMPTGTRPGPRAPGRPGMLPPFPEKLPPKAEPGKPLYTRKPPQRQRPVLDKREQEGERKLHPTRQRPGAGRSAAAAVIAPPEPRPPRDVTITEGITIRELAEKLDVRAKDLLKNLLDRGVFASINQALDVPTATTLAEAFSGVVNVVSLEEEMVLEVAKEETKESLKPRPPVVTVMGHVDHGKTSLLDAIREADVATGEAGGITQHIGAYKVVVNDRAVVFVDTPGHEAFTRMRARGAKVTDIVVLVVAADDGVMPQTKEAIDHARAAKVPIIVAINKIDKPEAQLERVKRQLTENSLMPAEWGGDTEFVEVSAKKKIGIEKLLETILLVADLRELKANPDAPATGTVLESRVDKGRGPVATILVQNGTLKAGDFFICGSVFGKVRAMFDDRGRVVNDAPPSTPVEVLGLQGVPDAGDLFQVTDEAKARHIVEYRQNKQRDAAMARISGSRITLDQLHEQLKAGDVKELGIVIKGDVQGSVEVLSEMLPKLSTDQVKLKIIGSGVGAVTENDVLLASASGAIVIAFGVRPDRKALDLAQQEHVDIRTHNIIYEVSDEIKKAMEGLLEPVVTETYLGRAEVRNTFRVKGAGTIAGCYVVDGILKRDAQVRVLRDGAVIYTSKLNSLKRFKDDASEVRTGFECGAGVANFNDIKVGDVLECFSVTKMSAAEAAGQASAPAGKR
ncbi:MAG: translation initiation factor IF-2 [Acidobacteria bacterium]|nr:MAG: translation initiation factor IF-2 [Acidobacteria bacterium 13_2_20CM_57_7]PYT39279.1 MAG: translation initiation factor IF-2 [Acidobacteriota bacterium]